MNFVTCHRRPDRSFFWRGKQFPVCARCTGIYVGYMTLPIFSFNLVTLPILVSILMILPTYIDGMTQYYFNRESNNTLRFVTGLIAGVGSMSLIAVVGQSIGRYLITLF